LTKVAAVLFSISFNKAPVWKLQAVLIDSQT